MNFYFYLFQKYCFALYFIKLHDDQMELAYSRVFWWRILCFHLQLIGEEIQRSCRIAQDGRQLGRKDHKGCLVEKLISGLKNDTVKEAVQM